MSTTVALTLRLTRLIEAVDVRARLPLLDIALPALRALTPAQSQRFRENVTELVQADAKIDLFEWSLHRILLRDVAAHDGNVRPSRVRYHRLRALQCQCEVVLSTLARAGHRDPEAASVDPEKPVATYCGTGYRASIAASVLQRHGFRNVSTVAGSMAAWRHARLPVEHAASVDKNMVTNLGTERRK